MSKKKFDFGHLRSQKFAGFVFGVFVCFLAGVFQVSEASTQAVVMGVVGLYTAFVGGRAWSDSAALKFGGTVGASDNEPSVVKKLPKKDDDKEKDHEVD
jgi:hypothetical protein